MNIELRQLMILREIARQHSFSIASDKLFLSQSTISAHVKNLESSLGLKLLDRSKAKIVPTQEGEIVLRYAEHILALIDEMQECLDQHRAGSRGSLTIEFASTVYSFVLPDIIYNFTKKFPDIHLRTNTGTTPTIIENVLSQKTQIGIIKMSIPHCNIQGLNSVLLEEDFSAVIASVNHPLLRKREVTMADIAECPLLFYGCNTSYVGQIKSIYEERGFAFHIAMKFDNLNAVLTMVQLGSGVCFLPSKVFQDSLSQGRVAVVPVKDMPPVGRFTFLISKVEQDEGHSPVHTFVQYVEDYGRVLGTCQ